MLDFLIHLPIGVLILGGFGRCVLTFALVLKPIEFIFIKLFEYVRAWKNDRTDEDWSGKYTPRHDRTKPTRITEYVRGFRQ